MSKKIIFTIILLPVLALVLVACQQTVDPIEIWVGFESKDFYQEKANEYIATYEITTGEKFPTTIVVNGVDTGNAADQLLSDPTTAGDIITVAHDNLGKLTAGSSAILPIQSESLLSQVNADNSESIINVIKSTVQDEEYYFGIPYISQALILYYNKALLTEQEATSWNSIIAKSKQLDKQALSITGTDGYNNSFMLLSVNEATKESSLDLFENAQFENTNATGADVVSYMKFAQHMFTTKNGANRPTDSGWEVELVTERSLSVISGAWHYPAAFAALGENLGISILPTFTLTEDTVYDVANNGHLVGETFRSGTFADVKMFVKNKATKHSDLLDGIIEFFSSKEIQEQSFVEANNLPSYVNASTEFDALNPDNAVTTEEKNALAVAKAQVEMIAYGRPQPFGMNAKFNTNYYSAGTSDIIMDIFDQGRGTGKYATDAALFTAMTEIQNIWINGIQ